MGNCLKNSVANEPIFMPDEEEDETDEYPRQVALGQNQPLLHQPIQWTSDTPLTEGQLRGKRDTFWDTAPLYEGRREVWDALRAAAEAAEGEDYDLAQAIVTGAGVSLPKGKLTDVYDELGNRYVIPKYCLAHPVNMITSDHTPSTSVSTGSKDLIAVKIRLSTQPKDIKCVVCKGDCIRTLKNKLQESHDIDPARVKMFLSGRLLPDNVLLGDMDIPRGFVIQAIFM